MGRITVHGLRGHVDERVLVDIDAGGHDEAAGRVIEESEADEARCIRADEPDLADRVRWDLVTPLSDSARTGKPTRYSS